MRRLLIVNGVGMVSPRNRAEQLYTGRTEDRIEAYWDRWEGWFFEDARLLLGRPHGDMVSCLS